MYAINFEFEPTIGGAMAKNVGDRPNKDRKRNLPLKKIGYPIPNTHQTGITAKFKIICFCQKQNSRGKTKFEILQGVKYNLREDFG